MKNKLIISDIDGTLINEDFIVPEINIEYIKKFQLLNGSFSVASGRCLNSIRKNFKDISFNGPGILFNGCVVYDFDNDKVINFESVDEIDGEKLINFVLTNEKYKTTGVLIFTIESTYSRRDNIILDKLIEVEGGGFHENEEYEIKSPWLKILFADIKPKLAELYEDIKKNFSLDKFDISFSHEYFMELLPKNINKGTAIEFLKSNSDFNNYKIYAVGDYYNDIEMLKKADVAICPENAPDDIKELASEVLCSNNDGVVAELIKKIISGEL